MFEMRRLPPEGRPALIMSWGYVWCSGQPNQDAGGWGVVLSQLVGCNKTSPARAGPVVMWRACLRVTRPPLIACNRQVPAAAAAAACA
jgi:hypothetical protein